MASSLRADRNRLIVQYPELRDWQNAATNRGRSDTGIENYMYTFVRFVEWADKSPLEATDSDIDAFLSSLPAGSRRTRRAHLASFYRWAKMKRRLDGENPMDFVEDIRQPPRKIIDTFEPWEQAALIQTDPGRVAIMLYTGLRQGEACRLRGRDIDLNGQRVIVRRGKGGDGRIVKFGEIAAGRIAGLMLFEGIRPDDHIWFDRPGGGRIRRSVDIGESAFRAWWKECLSEAGVRYRKPHTTRHTFATNALRAGVRIERLQKMMGHKSIQTTLNLYGHLTEQDIVSDMDLFDKLLRETIEVGA